MDLGSPLVHRTGLLGLLIACGGLYSSLAFDVAQRRRELGIRSALGASSRELVRLVLRGVGTPVIGGQIAGVGMALVAAPALEDLLFQTSVIDAGVYATVAGAMVLTGLLATLSPSLSAASSDPLEVIAGE